MPQGTKAPSRQKIKARPKQRAVTIPSSAISETPSANSADSPVVSPNAKLAASSIAKPVTVPAASPPYTEQPRVSSGFEQLIEESAKEVLTVSYWFDPAPQPQPYSVTIEFSGRRTDATDDSQPGNLFTYYEIIEEVLPGSGPISISTTIHDINPGQWEVKAKPVKMVGTARQSGQTQTTDLVVKPSQTPNMLVRFWRWWAPAIMYSGDESCSIHTHLSTFGRVPGVFPGAWISFVIAGFILAVITQLQIISHLHLHIGAIGLVDTFAIIAGIIGAKAWYIVKHLHDPMRWIGWCIQGFTTGTAISLAFLLPVNHVPFGTFFDITTPGMLAGMAIGRLGCFFAGCCGGPPTTLFFGIWSSDQRMGARRIPTQLMEATFTMTLAMIALIVVLRHGAVLGLVFVAGLSAYTLGRQGILRMRVEKQQANLRETIITALSASILVISTLLIIAQVK